MILGLIGTVSMFTGCAPDKLTRNNFDMIHEGTASKDEVALTLGKDYVNRGENEWEYERENKHLVVYIHFDQNGKVIRKEWIDAKKGEWEGAAPGINENKTQDPQHSSNTTIDP
jgi:hypothetical protein